MGFALDYYYSLTPRQFSNAVKGFRKNQESKSQEAWIIARRTAFWVLMPNLKEGAKESDIIVFPWEESTMRVLAEKELLEMQEQIKLSEDVFARYDAQKQLNT